ncbi:acyl-homoserine-lactone synthase [Falsiruegeria mediterranea]|uniref:acyl-homoserine-lactone synthase n=1 Tax=Falsiruegeria mediterranea M17 TaxID=1200281 RepID=A0A2R8CEU5_9RHOB|nr:acyl-homoserine-lactone synthase [Falsiruegeria mediterranea]SPJ30972.1 Acyl-homoserine-lactone synthase [Falsiruegeria mediterranea M17]
MELHTFTFIEQSFHGDCFPGYLRLRKRHFVDQLGWELSHDGCHEMDQYDHPLSIYSIVMEEGRVVGGARALPCNADWCGWSYMLGDAARGKIDAIPPDLMSNYPTSGRTWECTRLVLDDTRLNADERQTALKLVVHGLCRVARASGCEEMLSLSPTVFGRLLKRFGYDCQAYGRRYVGVEDGRLYGPFRMTCDPSVNLGLVERSNGDEVSSRRLLTRLVGQAA